MVQKTLRLTFVGLLVSGCSLQASDTETPPIYIAEQKDKVLQEITVEVPFSSQAPFGNWDDPYQEACEEMSVLMVHHFLQNTPLNPITADSELLKLIEWESEQGYTQDVSLLQLANIVESYFGYNTRVIESVDLKALQKELGQGNPVIVPAAGRQLGNPYFSGEGPWYHMLVLTGYDETHFISNDPGTKRGKDYRYPHTSVLNAIHDWTGVKEEIHTGARRALVITSP